MGTGTGKENDKNLLSTDMAKVRGATRRLGEVATQARVGGGAWGEKQGTGCIVQEDSLGKSSEVKREHGHGRSARTTPGGI